MTNTTINTTCSCNDINCCGCGNHEYAEKECPACGHVFCWSCCGGTNVHEGGKHAPDFMNCPRCGQDWYSEDQPSCYLTTVDEMPFFSHLPSDGAEKMDLPSAVHWGQYKYCGYFGCTAEVQKRFDRFAALAMNFAAADHSLASKIGPPKFPKDWE